MIRRLGGIENGIMKFNSICSLNINKMKKLIIIFSFVIMSCMSMNAGVSKEFMKKIIDEIKIALRGEVIKSEIDKCGDKSTMISLPISITYFDITVELNKTILDLSDRYSFICPWQFVDDMSCLTCYGVAKDYSGDVLCLLYLEKDNILNVMESKLDRFPDMKVLIPKTQSETLINLIKSGIVFCGKGFIMETDSKSSIDTYVIMLPTNDDSKMKALLNPIFNILNKQGELIQNWTKEGNGHLNCAYSVDFSDGSQTYFIFNFIDNKKILYFSIGINMSK